ncbi:hypothetical protein EBT31_11740 [bacterium]|nr:hypothetical protein [bacterium]
MSSTYSTNLALELIGTGDQAGNWGSTTNTNLGTLIEQAISGYVTQAVATGTDTTITIPNGATGVARNMFLELTGTGGASTNLIVPANKKLYFIYNNSTGAVTVKVSGQTGVSVPATAKIVLVCNGTDVVVAQNYIPSLISPTISNATLTGVPVAPTAAVGTNTTQIATTAFVTAGLQAAYPVGSIYVSTVSTNPNTLFGFGTWVAYGQGRMLISADGTYTAGTTGGSATTTLSTANLPSHTHSATTTSTDSGHTHGSAIGSGFISNGGGESLAGGPNLPFGRPSATASSTANITSTTTIGSTGSGTAVTTISPYIAVYMWNRTA